MISIKKGVIYTIFVILIFFNNLVYSQKILKINQFDVGKEEIQLSGNASENLKLH